MRLYLATTLLLCTACLSSGCGHRGPPVIDVRGTVTYRGQPLNLGTVRFTPASRPGEGSARPATSVIAHDGSYRLRAFPDRDGAQPGEYLVSVSSYTGSHLDGNVKHLIPEKFSATATSAMKATVPSESNDPVRIDFNLTD